MGYMRFEAETTGDINFSYRRCSLAFVIRQLHDHSVTNGTTQQYVAIGSTSQNANHASFEYNNAAAAMLQGLDVRETDTDSPSFRHFLSLGLVATCLVSVPAGAQIKTKMQCSGRVATTSDRQTDFPFWRRSSPCRLIQHVCLCVCAL